MALVVSPSKFVWVTLEQYKAFLDPNSADVKQDPVRQTLLNAACQQIERELKRPIVQRSYTDVFDGTPSLPGLAITTNVGIERLFLKPPVIVPVSNPGSAITVTEAAGLGTPVALTIGTDYFLYDDEGYIRRYAGTNPGRWAPGLQNITVTYRAGLCTQVWAGGSYGVGAFTGITPSSTRRQDYDMSSLTMAAMELAKFHEKSGPLDYDKIMSGGAFLMPSDMPGMIKRLIAPWRSVNL